jgi:hypothetical protein
MVNIQQITKELGYRVCLDCLNKRYHSRITEDDCIWAGSYPHLCRQCKCMTDDAIMDFNWKGKLKLLFKH